MFSSVEDSPVYLPSIPFGKECKHAFCIKKLENLSVGPGTVWPVSGVDLMPTETAQLIFHGESNSPTGGKMAKPHLLFLCIYFDNVM